MTKTRKLARPAARPTFSRHDDDRSASTQHAPDHHWYTPAPDARHCRELVYDDVLWVHEVQKEHHDFRAKA